MVRPHSFRSLVALALLGVLSLGSAGHFWHHLVDPDCDVAGNHGVEPCSSCSGLHSSVEANDVCVSAFPSSITITAVSLLETDQSAATVVPGGAARAPPAV
ncbi:MAG TPA: hypothetical protein VEY91_11140 [Candidatus Limnocylindria bacterium]|nr:hypothetical protein [Candidatus Limnocylindria bacterium]